VDSLETGDKWLHEWEGIMRRIESIDARLWQGAGILLVISIGGISLIGWNPPKTMADFIFVVVAGLVSLAILVTWWFMFHRWIYLQAIYSYRAREIEDKLDLRFNRYARLLAHWESLQTLDLGKDELKKKDPDAYGRLEDFWKKQKKETTTIQAALEWLTYVLGSAWVIFTALYTIAYFWPHILGLTGA